MDGFANINEPSLVGEDAKGRPDIRKGRHGDVDSRQACQCGVSRREDDVVPSFRDKAPERISELIGRSAGVGEQVISRCEARNRRWSRGQPAGSVSRDANLEFWSTTQPAASGQ